MCGLSMNRCTVKPLSLNDIILKDKRTTPASLKCETYVLHSHDIGGKAAETMSVPCLSQVSSQAIYVLAVSWMYMQIIGEQSTKRGVSVPTLSCVLHKTRLNSHLEEKHGIEAVKHDGQYNCPFC